MNSVRTLTGIYGEEKSVKVWDQGADPSGVFPGVWGAQRNRHGTEILVSVSAFTAGTFLT